MAPEAFPDQLVIPRAARSPGATKRQVQFVHVLWVHALGLDVDVALRFGCARPFIACGAHRGVEGTAELPSPLQGVPHHRAREHALAVVVSVQVLLCEMVHHVRWFCGGEEAGAGAVAEEAEVAVVCYDVDWRGVGGRAGRGGGARAVVVDGADVAAVEADSGAYAEHALVGGVDRVKDKRGRSVGKDLGADRDAGVQGEGGEVEGLG